MQTLTLRRPDDWHLHLRDGDYLRDTVSASAKCFKRALIMPNLVPPVTNIERLTAYEEKINTVKTNGFTPYFSLYLTEETDIRLIQAAKDHSKVLGFKLYPNGATTNSEQGANDIKALYPLFEEMAHLGVCLQVHGETTTGDVFEREEQFIKEVLAPLHQNFPNLKIVLEHISTKAAVDFVLGSANTLAATITIHHLLYNRNHLLAKNLKPHYYCLPILKSATNQQAIGQAALSGNPKFFLGTDSAPHAKSQKENACGCAGIYSAPYALNLYAEFFDNMNALDKLEPFASEFGANFYGLPLNDEWITLVKSPLMTERSFLLGRDTVIPIKAGETLAWSVVDE